jgi:hypothetical protein
VLGTYVLLQATLEHLARDGAGLRDAIQADRAARPAEVTFTWTSDGPTGEIDLLGVDYEIYRSAASGADELRWLGRPRLFPKLPIVTSKPGLTVKRPAAYWVPASKNEIIDRLRVQGIHVEPLSESRTLDVDMYRIIPSDETFAGRPYEARHPVRFRGVEVERRRETFPPGSVRVPTDQPLGTLAIMMLEPQGVDSLLGWGFCNEILQRTEYIEGYVIAPLAEKMLADDPTLKSRVRSQAGGRSRVRCRCRRSTAMVLPSHQVRRRALPALPGGHREVIIADVCALEFTIYRAEAWKKGSGHLLPERPGEGCFAQTRVLTCGALFPARPLRIMLQCPNPLCQERSS